MSQTTGHKACYTRECTSYTHTHTHTKLAPCIVYIHGANAANTSAVDWLVAAASSAWFSYRSVMSVFVYRKHTKLTVCNLFKDVLPTFAGAAGGNR